MRECSSVSLCCHLVGELYLTQRLVVVGEAVYGSYVRGVVTCGFLHFVDCRILCCRDRYFFFFKQNTAYEWRIIDWSSDVCSSDLMTKLPRSSARRMSRPKACASRDRISRSS